MLELHEGEVIKDVVGYEGLYGITNQGRAYGYKSRKWLRPRISYRGYYLITLLMNGKPHQHSLHRVVGHAFIPNPKDKPQINHIDGDKLNNHVDNLEWVTASENMQHCYELGLNKCLKLSAAQKKEIKELYASGAHSLSQLGEMYGVTHQSIWYLVHYHKPADSE